ncbi:hypothetical protein GQ54DRAFT_297806 [Martensiomyces pterosporus]|nr:hypothetical protein GQ54DRAFT_297806 [Martensiomyces pterosporus]
MPNNKRKRLSTIKGKEKAHPYSRKARQINRAMQKESRIAEARSHRIDAAMSQGQKVLWFRDNMDLDEEGNKVEDERLRKSVWTKAELGRLLDAFLARSDEEISEIKERRRPGRPLPPKDEFVLQANEVENKEARLAGLDIPDLTNGNVVRTLRAWDGDLNSITTIKLVKCKPASEFEREAQEKLANGKDAAMGDAKQSKKLKLSAEEQAIAEATGMIVS